MELQLRVATESDVPALNALIELSVRQLSVGFYTHAQVDAALAAVFGVDSQLIADRTYYIIEADDVIAAAGGWSGRRTLYGGDQSKRGEDTRLDPASEPARIRAFFVHPAHARQGLARRLWTACADAARSAGFQRIELMATMPGVPLYRALGFTDVEQVMLTFDGVNVPFIRMARALS